LAGGKRIAKHIYDNSNNWEKSTFYVHDAQGNVMSVYTHSVEDQTISFTQAEKHIYGSSRVGMDVTETELISAPAVDDTLIQHLVGNKRYELSGHTNNVLAVISDKKIPIEDGQNPGEVDYFEPELITSVDYSPGGVQLSGRTWDSQRVKYGFSSMLKDDEIKGAGNSYDFGARMYDTRLVVWHNLDQMYMKYPARSPYSYAANNPIFFVDPDGNDIVGFEALLAAKKYTNLLKESQMFITFMSQFQSTTSGEIVDKNKGDGIYKDINLKITVLPKSDPNNKTSDYKENKDLVGDSRGVAMINVKVDGKWKNLASLTDEEAKTIKNAEFQIHTIVKQELSSADLMEAAIHELVLHGESFAKLIEKEKDNLLNLRECYDEACVGGGESDHKIMHDQKKSSFLTIAKDVYDGIKAVQRGGQNLPTKDGDPNGPTMRLDEAFKIHVEFDVKMNNGARVNLDYVKKD
jgi:RHS repeat-associated protein